MGSVISERLSMTTRRSVEIKSVLVFDSMEVMTQERLAWACMSAS